MERYEVRLASGETEYLYVEREGAATWRPIMDAMVAWCVANGATLHGGLRGPGLDGTVTVAELTREELIAEQLARERPS